MLIKNENPIICGTSGQSVINPGPRSNVCVCFPAKYQTKINVMEIAKEFVVDALLCEKLNLKDVYFSEKQLFLSFIAGNCVSNSSF